MIEEFLKKVPLFADLYEADLKLLSESVEIVRLGAGEFLFKEGDPADKAYVIQEGEVEVLKDAPKEQLLLATRRPGEVIGEIALVETSSRTASVRARRDSVLYAIGKEQLERMLQTSISAANSMYNTMLARWRETERLLRQSEKMAELGKLTAQVAHELNNPASAVKRGSDQLRTAIQELGAFQTQISRLDLSPEQNQILQNLEQRVLEMAAQTPEMDAVSRSDLETEIGDWLEERGVAAPWQVAPAFINLNYDLDELAGLSAQFSPEALPQVAGWLNALYAVHNLLHEVGQGSSRISEIVKTLKSYAYLDRAPVQNVDVNQGLENTLRLLRGKIGSKIRVRRELAQDLPGIYAYGGALNQVWMNLIDNALDALDGQGEIIIRSRQEGDWVMVEIEDNGPGIPAEIQGRIFEPFFTTKPIGKGTGLGLDISYDIVVQKHRGEIKVESQPGKTIFQVRLPLSFENPPA